MITSVLGRRPRMRGLAMLAAAAAAAALAAGCATATRPAHAAARHPVTGTSAPATTPVALPAPSSSAPVAASGYSGPHFDTPQAAMRYLAAAYNTGDLTALHHVTEQRAFGRLMLMRSDAVNLRLRYCTPNPRGDYTCHFRHDFPASEHRSGHGEAVFIAAPALNPGWYMYQFQSCD